METTAETGHTSPFVYTPDLVTDVLPREPKYVSGVTAPILFNTLPEGAQEAWQDAGGSEMYCFRNLHEYEIAMNAVAAILHNNPRNVVAAQARIDQSTIPSRNELSEPEKWARSALQLPGDWGPDKKYRTDMRERFTSTAKGVVLEAMCGFDTYIDDSPDITEVIAMDFCQEALQLYERPERKRVLFDLNSISAEGGLDFLAQESIDTVCISFGVDYLDDPAAVYKEFNRVLREGGKLLIFAGEGCGYPELLRRSFRPNFHQPLLENAGFAVNAEKLPYEKHGESSYYLLDATKPTTP